MSVIGISPGEVCKRQHKTYRSHPTHSNLYPRISYFRLQGHKERDTTIIYKSYESYMSYTFVLLTSIEYLNIQTTSVYPLIMCVTRVIWHQRIWHIQTKRIGRTTKVVNGIPPLSLDTDLDGCDVCFTCKMRITAA